MSFAYRDYYEEGEGSNYGSSTTSRAVVTEPPPVQTKVMRWESLPKDWEGKVKVLSGELAVTESHGGILALILDPAILNVEEHEWLASNGIMLFEDNIDTVAALLTDKRTLEMVKIAREAQLSPSLHEDSPEVDEHSDQTLSDSKPVEHGREKVEPGIYQSILNALNSLSKGPH